MKKKSLAKVKALVVVGDTHCGSSVGLLPPGMVGYLEFWGWVNRLLKDEPWVFVHLGDMMDNRHHKTTQLASGNLAIQQRITIRALKKYIAPAVKSFFIKGTQAHCGEAGELEEMTVRHLLGVDEETADQGDLTQWDLLLTLGEELIHFAHHVPTTTSAAYKSSPLMRLMAASFATAGEWQIRPPTMLVRGHCHDYTEVVRANCRVVTCPSWQGKTGWAWGRDTIERPIVGGLIIRLGQEGVHVRRKIFAAERPEPVVV